jgi:hypothetical protein
MGLFKKAKEKMGNAFDGEHLKHDVENGKLERGSLLWGVRSATIGAKEIIKEVAGRTVTIANSERDKRVGYEEQKTPKEEKAIYDPELEMDEMQEFEEWKKFQAYKRKNK